MITRCIKALGCAAAMAGAMAVPRARANHGPGTSGGGSTTISGETLKQGMFDLSFRVDYTEFEHLSRAQAEQRALRSGEFDAITRSVIPTATLAYGLSDDFQISGTIGWYLGSNFIDAESADGDEVESSTADPSGLTDLWLNAKYRFMRNRIGNLAVIGGIKVPVGDNRERLSNRETLEPSSQPGSGAFDFQGGLAYSRFLTSNLTIDASSVYTIRTEHDDFKVGDRLDAGIALAYRLTDDIKAFPNCSVFGEALAIWLGKDHDDGELNPNSGGVSVYLSPGFRARLNPTTAITFAPAFPVLQDLNGDQIKTQFKISMTLSFSF